MFKVVPDQLRVSEGWVRCGQCDEIFDASANLQDGEPAGFVEPAAREPQVLLAHERADAPPASADRPTGPDDDDDALVDLPPLTEADPMEPEAPETIGAFGHPEADDHEDPVELVSAYTDMPAPFAQTPEPVEPVFTHVLASEHLQWPQVSFMREARPPSIWRRPLVRLTLILISLVLMLGLMGQVVVHERDRIAAADPALKPWVQAACTLLACTLSPLQQIESMVIDSSSFNKIRGDAYRLNFTLKNTAHSELATPSIELTLTDSQDRPVIRRVFMPADVGLPPRVLAPGSESNGSLAVNVKTTVANERIAGYRVLAFYP
jgi:hypothetical protein